MEPRPSHAQPSPALVFETLTAHQRTAALAAAIELDVFGAIGEGRETTGAEGASDHDGRYSTPALAQDPAQICESRSEHALAPARHAPAFLSF